MDYIFGYINFIDGSARGLPPPGNVFFQMKSRDTFAPIGPYLVTKDEIADPQKLPIKLWVNGELKQDFNTDDMAHNIPRCIEWATSIHTLEPGDILATGTNHRGLSQLHGRRRGGTGDAGLGRLRFNIRDDLKRTWLRETRLDRQQEGKEGPTPQVSGKYAPTLMRPGLSSARSLPIRPTARPFDHWYRTEHLPDALKAFNAIAAMRGWSTTDPSVQCACYRFDTLDAAQAISNSSAIKALIAEFDRRWGTRVIRTRDIVDNRRRTERMTRWPTRKSPDCAK